MLRNCRCDLGHMVLPIILFQLGAGILTGFAIADQSWYNIPDVTRLRHVPMIYGIDAQTHGLFPKSCSSGTFCYARPMTHLDRCTIAFMIFGMLFTVATSIVALIFYLRYMGLCCKTLKTTDATFFNVILGMTWMTTFILSTGVIIFWMSMPNRVAIMEESLMSVTQKPGKAFFMAVGAACISFVTIAMAVLLELVLQKIDFY